MPQHVVIIGGSSGIGLAAAGRLLADGCRVTIAGRDKARLDAALEVLAGQPAGGPGGRISGQCLDATDDTAVREFFTGTGPFDHLVVTVSGAAGVAPLDDLTGDGLRAAFDGKPLAHLSCVRAARPSLAAGGSVVLVSAASARSGIPGTAGLAAVNGAVEAMVPVLAVELAPVRVNAVSPGVIDTPWWNWLPGDARTAAMADAAAASPVGRAGRPEDVADAIAFLLRNAFTTGVVLPCDGGALLRPAS
jgi:NAD(P)-dependent dehydrogenase (short-subunit alcohol dehydrogenase family)